MSWARWIRWHPELAVIALLGVASMRVSPWLWAIAAVTAGVWAWQEHRQATRRQRLATPPGEPGEDTGDDTAKADEATTGRRA